MPYCPKCGKEVPEGSTFCPNCGIQVSKPPVQRPTVTKDIGKSIIIAVVVIIIILAGLYLIGTGTIFNLFQRLKPPDVEITSKSVRTTVEGLDYVAYVDVSVYNRGGPGTVTIWAEVWQDSGEHHKKAQSIHLDPKESKDLTFRFSEVGFWTLENIYYRVWVEY